MNVRQVLLHPALLLSSGNTALAVETAEPLAITINVTLVIGILFSRVQEVHNEKAQGVSFNILALVNFGTALSVVYTNISGSKGLLAYAAALSYVAWGVGHIFAGYNEKHSDTAKSVLRNPQFFYGIGDTSAVNASGQINPYSIPFMIIGFVKSLFIGKILKTNNKLVTFIYSELTAARLYAAGFTVGAMTSTSTPYLFVAQMLWGLGYLQFKKDT